MDNFLIVHANNAEQRYVYGATNAVSSLRGAISRLPQPRDCGGETGKPQRAQLAKRQATPLLRPIRRLAVQKLSDV